MPFDNSGILSQEASTLLQQYIPLRTTAFISELGKVKSPTNPFCSATLLNGVAGVWEKGGRNIPLGNRSYDSSSELDLNSTLFQDNGIYDLADVIAKNFPNNSGGVPQKIYSTLITFQSYYGIQFFFNHDFSGGLWMRTFYRNTKEVLDWKRIIL